MTLTKAAIQFPHPGREHEAGPHVGGVFPWNVGEHRRKFLETSGAWVDSDGRRGEGPLRFWGEWEATSHVTSTGAENDRHPRFVHRPLWEAGVTGRRQNTDPLVLSGFRYSNCKQHHLKEEHSPTKQYHLDVGSVVLFGSKVSGQWVLDTVFVVAAREEYGRDEVEELAARDPLLGYAAVQPLYSNPGRHLRFVLYRGATVDAPVDGRFSFVPALPVADGSFTRPALTHPARNDNLTMSTRTLATDDEVHEVWEWARQDVLDAKLVLATRLDGPAPPAVPAHRPTPETVGDASRAC